MKKKRCFRQISKTRWNQGFIRTSALEGLENSSHSPKRPGLWIRVLIVPAALLFFSGCAAQKPVLYPNAHLQQVGPQQAQADIDACMEMARTHGVKDTAQGKVAKNTARSAAVGAAAGAASSAVWGGNVGKSAAAGGAGAAAGTAVAGMFDQKGPDPVFQQFVNQCLKEKGYQVTGWQ